MDISACFCGGNYKAIKAVINDQIKSDKYCEFRAMFRCCDTIIAALVGFCNRWIFSRRRTQWREKHNFAALNYRFIIQKNLYCPK